MRASAIQTSRYGCAGVSLCLRPGDFFNRGLEIVQIVAEHMADLAPDRPLERQQQPWRQALRVQLELDTDLRADRDRFEREDGIDTNTAAENPPFIGEHCGRAVG